MTKHYYTKSEFQVKNKDRLLLTEFRQDYDLQTGELIGQSCGPVAWFESESAAERVKDALEGLEHEEWAVVENTSGEPTAQVYYVYSKQEADILRHELQKEHNKAFGVFRRYMM